VLANITMPIATRSATEQQIKMVAMRSMNALWVVSYC
jgi:hypothetical protein